MPQDNAIDKIRIESWDNSFHTFGTAYIFNKRAVRYSAFVTWLKVFGIVVPVVVGATVTGYGLDSDFLKWLIAIAIPLSIIQLVFSVLAVIYKWDEELAYSYEASKDHNFLSQEFKSLANIPIANDDLKSRFDILVTKLQSREEQDSKHNIMEWENRMGMKFALRQFKRECVGCHVTPVSMESTACDICGKYNNFTTKLFKS
jgi:mobilome CxxCx(11)CxxC protein